MFYVSEIFATAPAVFSTELQKKVYETLDQLAIPFERVDTDEAITMEDCVLIDRRLDMKMVKTLFLCDRGQTEFYLYVTTARKRFNSGEFSRLLDTARVSFAPVERLQSMLGTKVGAATVLSVLLDSAHRVRVVVDREVLQERWYGCSDGTTTGYLKIETSRVIDDFLPHVGHRPLFIDI